MILTNSRIAILVEQQYQEMEVWYPLYRFREAGAQVVTVGGAVGAVYPSKVGYPCLGACPAKLPADFAFLRRHYRLLPSRFQFGLDAL